MKDKKHEYRDNFHTGSVLLKMGLFYVMYYLCINFCARLYISLFHGPQIPCPRVTNTKTMFLSFAIINSGFF